MPPSSSSLFCLGMALLVAAPTAAMAQDAPKIGMPAGFADLAKAQQVIADIYYGGDRVGEAQLEFQGGTVRLADPALVADMLPGLTDPAAVRAALTGALENHAALVCTPGADLESCGRLSPTVAGVIFDQDHFRLSIFVNTRYLAVRSASDETYLPAPTAGLSLVDWVAGTVAGSSSGGTDFAIQNRAVLGIRDARLVSTTSYASGIGLKGDVLAAQLDKPGVRYTAGAFWAPGLDLVGRRRIVGASVETQFDTRADKDILIGSPLILSLAQRARVDLLVDNRLVGSRIYDAGNQSLDTSALPDGAYEVVLRIQEFGGAQRQERRFFTKNARIAPVGEWLWFARGGVLVQDRPGAFLSATRDPYAEAGMSRRIGRRFALDGTLVATSDRVMAEVGAYLLTAPAQFRVALLGTTKQDSGFLFQANSTGGSPFNFNIDARRIQSHDDRPLIAAGGLEPGTVMSATATMPIVRTSGGSFTQLMGEVGYRLKNAQLNFSAFYRRDRRQDHYAVGPTARWSVLHRAGLDLTLEANLAQSSIGRSGYAGIRLQLLQPRHSLSATAGVQSIPSRGQGRKTDVVGGIQGSWQDDDVLGGNLVLVGSVDHMPGNDIAHGRADLRGPMGALAADVVQQIGGAGQSQFSLTGQTAAIANRHMASLGSRDQSDSMIAVRVQDAPPAALFEVLVNETPRGHVRGGQTLALAVPPYRQYGVRIRPVGGGLVHFDNGARRVSVYPGNVATLAWSVKSVAAMFGRLVWSNGLPVTDADIVARDAVAHTDQAGYFQIETTRSADLTVRAPDGRTCTAMINAPETSSPYVPLGTVACATQTPFGPPRRIAANEER